MSEFVSVHTGEQEPRIATLLLSRPPTNALTRQVYRELTEAVAELAERSELAAIIVYGGHEIFSAGEDMPELQTLDVGEAAAAAQLCHDAIEALAGVPRPTIAAITGYALGAGLTLALAADWRVSGDNAKFGSTEILAGMVPSAGTTRLAAAVGPSKARDLVFTGRFVDAREALALGLVDELVSPDGVYDAALARARRFLDYPPHVLAGAKATFDRP
ncbi:enoyl-CoA hydratase [Mycolicibacterium sp. 018/SC-01/001]|uniref:enoyl-CoA hydratase n=1 Tax=Mycolicibacterium sp. 018/SC-01/001 TaxID=2592069 RepID=UPI00118149C2|nr:enoyl-CoA hydratase [Mycolicibacterium sp. 018/SC-01/001]TRW81461.1 enoyl-CoA hydratase [Mycolicibacterium sp. 018/SC-01/001]